MHHKTRRALAVVAAAFVVTTLIAVGTFADVVSFDIVDQSTSANTAGGGSSAVGVWFTVPTGVVDNRTTTTFPSPLFENGKYFLVWDTRFVQPEAEVFVEGLFANGNDVLCTPDGNPKKFADGATINAGAGGPSTFVDLGPTFGNWELGDHGYLGLKFPIAGQIHYGYAEIDIRSDASITLLGFAYESVAGASITTAPVVPEPASTTFVVLATAAMMRRRPR